MNRRGAAAIAVAILTLSIAACGEEDGPSYSDNKIVEKLNLKESEAGFAIDGDPFCEVDKELYNDSDEINDVAKKDRGLIVTSRAGNVAVEGVPPFADDCRDVAQKKLTRLDPEPVEE